MLLEKLYRQEILSPEMCKEAIDTLLLQQVDHKLNGKIAGEVSIAHKTGEDDCLSNDVGIVYTKKGNYMLAMFYNGNVATMEEYALNDRGRNSDALLADISGEIYKEFMK